jgi:hypothetical protein
MSCSKRGLLWSLVLKLAVRQGSDLAIERLKLRRRGHAPLSGKTHGESAAKFFEGFFPSVIAISTLGASITFTVIVSSLPEPKQTFAEETVRTFLAIAWLLFILGLTLGTFLGSGMIFHSDEVRKGFELDSQSARIRWWGIMTILVLEMIIIGSFLLLSLVVIQ